MSQALSRGRAVWGILVVHAVLAAVVNSVATPVGLKALVLGTFLVWGPGAAIFAVFRSALAPGDAALVLAASVAVVILAAELSLVLNAWDPGVQMSIMALAISLSGSGRIAWEVRKPRDN